MLAFLSMRYVLTRHNLSISLKESIISSLTFCEDSIIIHPLSWFYVWPPVPAEGLFFCLCLRSFKFHFNNVRPLLAVQAAEVHVFDEPVSRRPRRDSVLFRPVREARDAPPITVKPTQAARAYYTHACPITWYSGIPPVSDSLRSFSQQAEHL